MRVLLIFILFLLSAAPAQAVNPDEVLSDPALEARARVLSAKLRCLVCQNQSIDDSDAELAKDLRVLVRERLVAGDSNEAALDYIVARYGEYVLLQPRLGVHTALLWASPIMVLAIGIAVIYTRRRKHAELIKNIALSADEEEALKHLLNKEN